MNLVLIGNYSRDQQQSMLRYADFMYRGLSGGDYFDHVELWQPPAVLARPFAQTTEGIVKWLGYIDKMLLGPVSLYLKRLQRTKDCYYHICDHSNAYYRAVLPPSRTTIVCHDVLAIRGALLSDNTVRANARPTGALLQRYIMRNLLRIPRVACISKATLNELKDLSVRFGDGRFGGYHVVYNGFTAHWQRSLAMPSSTDGDLPYLLHVGSDHPRKNRGLIVEMLGLLKDTVPSLRACFAGQALAQHHWDRAEQLEVSERIDESRDPSNEELARLYSHCAAFVFPSYSEGFGLPLAEAQCCGAPVIASDRGVLVEATGGAALHCDPDDPHAFARAFLHLQNPSLRDELVRRGSENVKRFNPDTILAEVAGFISESD